MTVPQGSVKRGRSARFMEILYIPWVDRLIAVLAITPNIIGLIQRSNSDNLIFLRAILSVPILIFIVTMVVRRPPLRVTPNPWFWLLAFVASYGMLAYYSFAPNGRPLVPQPVSASLAILSLLIMVFARLSLGRSIGFVPANRGIVTTGAYRYVRHPIYTGIFVGMAAFLLRNYTPLNVVLGLTLVILFMIKSVVEESFLKDDTEYAAYLRKVRSRWFPGLA
jgi:protein-S-isoprenylcysteine O-methyltransferase Ste14